MSYRKRPRLLLILICAALLFRILLLQAQPDDEAGLVHRVGAGETLTLIARSYGVTLERLLSLNGLNPDAYLQIGQRLIVIPADELEGAQEESAANEAVEEEAEPERSVGGNVLATELPPAPVAEADAPMMNPADFSPRLCFGIYLDENQNGMRDPGEDYQEGGEIILLDGVGAEQLRYSSAGQNEMHCLRELERQLYRIEGIAPAGFGLTGSASLNLDLRLGGDVEVEFGVKEGLSAFTIPHADAAAEPPIAEEGGSLLRELSGVFLLGMAAFVLFSGLVVSIFVRGR